MVGFEILIRIKSEKRVEFLQAFEMVQHIEKLDDNRIDLNLFEEVKDSNTFLWVEHWDNNEFLYNYYCTNEFMAMMGAIDVLGQLVHKRSFLIMEEKENA